MNYIELSIPVAEPSQSEIVTAELAEFPFESFVEERGRLKAYIPQEALYDCKDDVDAMLAEMGIEGVRYVQIESQNWNALWESNFEEVEIDTRAVIRAPFHAPRPDVELELAIMPRMSFGTGHHATTHMMVEMVLDCDVHGNRVLDMGCGTGVLAIAAAKRGALSADAIDIDPEAVSNCVDNCRDNGVSDVVCPRQGTMATVAGREYDLILANINRNILVGDMDGYAKAIALGGEVCFSGFLEEDIPVMCAEANARGLKLNREKHMNGWVALSFIRK